MLRRLLLTGVAALSLLAAAPASAQPEEDPADNIEDQVARVLYERGVTLYQQGDYANARKMFVESLERSPEGPSSKDAIRMLRNANEKLGYEDLDSGRPDVDTGEEGPIDPYGDESQLGGPIDPYGDGQEEPIDPYGDVTGEEGGATAGAAPKDELPSEGARRALYFWGGAYGLLGGLAVAGPEDEFGDISGGAVLGGLLGAGAGIGLSHLWWKEKPMTPGQTSATISAGVWGAYNFALLGDLVTGIDSSDANDIYRSAAVGGLLGTGAGALYAYKAEPGEDEIAFTNSLSLYGTAGGLLLGVALDPAESEAFSLHAFLGSAAGIGAGLYLADKVEVTRRRMLLVDLGAAAGAAAPWVLVYPLMSDGSSSSDEQVAGFLSTLTLAGGAITAWFLTDDEGDGQESLNARSPERDPPPPALVRRSGSGDWSLGAPVLRPIRSPALAPPSEGPALGVDVLSGRF